MNYDLPRLQKGASPITEHTALLLLFISAAGAGALFLLATKLGSAGVLGMAFLCCATAYTCLLAFFHGRVQRLAFEELLLNREASGPAGSLFSDEGAAGDRCHVWAQCEKWFIPLASVVLLLGELAAAGYLVMRLQGTLASPVENGAFKLWQALALGVMAFAFFLLGRYAAGLGYSGERRQLRAPASLFVFLSFHLGVAVAAFLAAQVVVSSEGSAFRNPEPFLTGFAAIVFGLFALQRLALMILAFYRPKSADPTQEMPLYENRLTGLLAQPEGVWAGVAEIVDYQFGLRVSRSKFQTFFVNAFLPFLVFQLLTLALISCVVVVPAGQRGFVERWGRVAGAPLEPGLHFKFPWPAEKVHYSQADQIVSFKIGSFVGLKMEGPAATARFWERMPEDAPLFLTANQAGDGSGKAASIVNLLAVEVEVQYVVDRPEAYYYRHATPLESLKELATNELLSYLARHDGLALIRGEGGFNLAMRDRLDTLSKRLDLGIRVNSVALLRAQPPTRDGTVAAFHLSMVNEQKSMTMVCDAESFSSKLVPEATSAACALVNAAKSYNVAKVLSAKADADVFARKYQLYASYPGLYPTLAYLERFQTAARAPRKTVLATDIVDQVFSLDLKNEVNPEMLDMMNAEPTEK